MVNPLTLALLAGLLNGAAFVYCGELALIANVPLLLSLSRQPSLLRAAALGGLVGALGGLHIYGILDYGGFLFFAFAAYTCSQMVLYGLVLNFAWHRGAGRGAVAMDVLLPALVWTLTEWLRTLGPLCMPASYAGCIAGSVWATPLLVFAPWIGGLGVSFLIALIQSTIYHLTFGPATHRSGARAYAAALVALVAVGASIAPDLGERPLRVAGVQGGLPNSAYVAAAADRHAERAVIETFATLTQRAYATGASLVIWPETALRSPVLLVPELLKSLAPPADAGSQVLIAGLPLTDEHDDKRNAALVIGASGQVLDRYFKVRLVPGHESAYVAGERWHALQTPHGRIGVMICLESVYGEIGRALVNDGAELLVVMTNDAGFRRTPIARHMTRRAIVQAVENGRWLVRVGQAGISTVIDPAGRAHGELDLFEFGLLEAEVLRRTDLTLYARLGDWIIYPVGLALLVILHRAKESRRRMKTPAA